MSDGTVRVDGARELRASMRRAGEDLAQMRDLNRDAAETVASAAEAECPVGPSGDLRKTIRAGATQRAGIVRAGRARVQYAGPIHWGWPRRNIAPNPFMTRAAQATESQWVDNYTQGVEKILDRIKGA